jgi:hypothetical protein
MARRAHARESVALNIERMPSGRPKSKIGQLRWLWPEILTALAAGHSLKDVWEELGRDDIELSYSKFRSYVARLRKTHSVSRAPALADVGGDHSARPESKDATPVRDPLANLREKPRDGLAFTMTKRRQTRANSFKRGGRKMSKVNSDATCNGAIHLSLQGKRGVAKSLVASILAQYLIARERPLRCVDTDPINKTLLQYKCLPTEALKLCGRAESTNVGLIC